MNKFEYPNQIYCINSYQELESWNRVDVGENIDYAYYKTEGSNFLLVFELELSYKEFIHQINIDDCYLTKEEALNSIDNESIL